MRPKTLSEVIGHEQLTSEGSVLDSIINSQDLGGTIPSIIFWGPPGCGKTTIAKIIAKQTSAAFIDMSAISSGIKDLRNAISGAEKNLAMGLPTILFIDEIHRFNKTQQDAMLGAVENGSLSFIGATTENPSFEVNRALLSRATVLRLEQLTKQDILKAIDRACSEDELISKYKIIIDNKERLAQAANGDVRSALNILELALRLSYNNKSKDLLVTSDILEKAIAGRARNYDKTDDYHYDNISAFIKSMRGSDPDAALLWMMNMIEGGEDPKFIARRMLIFASEDIGMADSNAMVVANNAFEAIEKIGLPEALYPLVHCCIYLSVAKKSNAIKVALSHSKSFAIKNPNPEVPFHLRNGVTTLMKETGYGKGYKYPPDYENSFVEENYFPTSKSKMKFYDPLENEIEQKIRKIMKERWGDRYE